jgi:hypothetical protein
MHERIDMKSPVREYRPPGSVRGAPGTRRPHLDSVERPEHSERSTCNVQLSTFNGVTGGGMAGGIWGQTRNLDDRTLGPLDLSKGRAGRPKPAGRPDMGTGTMSGTPIRNVERPTFNSQLSTG